MTPLSRAKFARSISIWVAALIASIVLLPFFYYYIIRPLSPCARDTCGAASLVFFLTVKPVILLVFAAMAIHLLRRRLAGTSLPITLAFAITLAMVGDWGYLLGFMAPWSVGFVTGIAITFLPFYLIAALAWFVFLALWEGNRASSPLERKLRTGVMILTIALALVAVLGFALLFSNALLPLYFHLTMSIGRLIVGLVVTITIVLLGLLIALERSCPTISAGT